jgi:hypothetical protein
MVPVRAGSRLASRRSTRKKTTSRIALTKAHGGEQAQGPGEGDAPQEAEEERWIAERREQAAPFEDDEDEEDDHVAGVAAALVGAQERADEQRRGAGGADQAGQERAVASTAVFTAGSRPGPQRR